MQPFIFQDKPENVGYEESVRLAKQPIFKGVNAELAAILPPMRVSPLAKKYMVYHGIEIDQMGINIIDEKQLNIIPKHLMLADTDFTAMYLYKNKLCIVQKRRLPVEGVELYEKKVVLYDAEAGQIIPLSENTVITNGRKRLGYDEVLETVKGQLNNGRN